MCWLQLLLLCGLACLGLSLLGLWHLCFPLALGHSTSSSCLSHCCGWYPVASPFCSSCQALGLNDCTGSPGFGQRAARDCINDWWVQTSPPHPPATTTCVCSGSTQWAFKHLSILQSLQ